MRRHCQFCNSFGYNKLDETSNLRYNKQADETANLRNNKQADETV
jgi:hypothetical protein